MFDPAAWKVTVRYVPGENLERTLKTDPGFVKLIRETGERFAIEARAAAPRDSGGGADSIRAHESRAMGATDVGWDAEHYYLIFPEYGTEFQFEQRFMRDLLYEGFSIE
jgi:hypothetical protein